MGCNAWDYWRPDTTQGLNPVAAANPVLSGVGVAAQGLGALSGGLSAYTGYKALGLAEDQFDFQKALAESNFGNQAQLVNSSIQNAGEVGLSLAGNTLNDEQRVARQIQLDANKVKTTIA